MKPTRPTLAGIALAALTAFPLTSALRADTPISAYSIANNIGINARFGLNAASGQAYRDNLGPLGLALSDAGVRHIRSAVGAGFESHVLSALQDNGRHILLCAVTTQTSGSHLDGTEAGVATALSRLAAIRNAGRLRYIEGPNEWNGNGPTDWAPDLADYQRQLYRSAKQGLNPLVPSPGYSAYSVVQASVNTGSSGHDHLDYAAELAALCCTKADWGSGHIYGGSATSFETRFESNLERLEAIPPADPYVLTESGLSTTAGVGLTINEEVKAKYVARFFMDVAQRHPLTIRSAYYFELYEAATNSGAATTMGLIEEGTLVRKRSFYAFRNMLWLLGSPNTTSLPSLTISLSGSTVGQVERQLVRRSDGVYLLFLWQDKALWNTGTAQPNADADGTVDVDLNLNDRPVRIYRPAGEGWNTTGNLSGFNAPRDTRNTNGSGVLVDVPINGGMTVLEFKSSGSLPSVRTSPPAWTPGL